MRGKRCPVCGDFLVLKKGRYGLFYACNDKKCSYTENYQKEYDEFVSKNKVNKIDDLF